MVMVVMVSGIYGPSCGSIDARNHDNHDPLANANVFAKEMRNFRPRCGKSLRMEVCDTIR